MWLDGVVWIIQLMKGKNKNEPPKFIGSRDSSVGIATGYGLVDQGEREFESW
jgi:hypothetical protein